MKHALLRAALVLALMPAGRAAAEGAPLEFGRYLAKYPGFYGSLALTDDPRDAVFDADGDEQAAVAPAFGPGGDLAQRRLDVGLEWYFPLFEPEAIPFVSSRLWTARARLGHASAGSSGPLADFAAASGLARDSGGITDIEVEFGPVLAGSVGWRERAQVPYSVLLLLGARLPVGTSDPDSPNNAGANAFAWHATLGGYWQFADGWLLDAGATFRSYGRNEEPAFGAQEPSRQGDDIVLDLSVARRLLQDVYLSAFLYDRDGAASTYEDVRFAANAPQPPPLSEVFPDPGLQRDGGTAHRAAGIALHWFATPRLAVALHWRHPLAGESGEFDLGYFQQLEDCQLLGCDPQFIGTRPVDGLGAARSFASDALSLTLRYGFGQGDPWLRGP